MDVWEGYHEPSQTGQCSELLDRARELAVCMEIYKKPCMCQETFMQSTNVFLHGETIAAI